MLLARARATTQYICTYDNSVNSEVTYENVISNPSVSADRVTVTGIDSPDSDIVVIQGIEYPLENSPTEHDLQGPVIVEETSLDIQPQVFEETADYDKTARDDCLVVENTYRDLLEVWPDDRRSTEIVPEPNCSDEIPNFSEIIPEPNCSDEITNFTEIIPEPNCSDEITNFTEIIPEPNCSDEITNFTEIIPEPNCSDEITNFTLVSPLPRTTSHFSTCWECTTVCPAVDVVAVFWLLDLFDCHARTPEYCTWRDTLIGFLEVLPGTSRRIPKVDKL